MPHDSPLLRVHTLRSDEGRMQPNELMEQVTKLSDRVAVLENDLKQTKKTYGVAFTKLIKKMIHHDVQTQERQEYDLEPDFEFTAPEEVYIVKPDISTAGAEVSTAVESLVYIRRSAIKRKDKGKAIVEESEPTQTKTKIQQEQERLGLQAQERERYSEADKAKLLVELINERKRQFAQQRAQQRRNMPLIQAQQRSYMCNYIKHMGSHTLQQLIGYSFDEIKVLFEATVKRVNTFTPIESDDTVPKVVAGSSKRQKIREGLKPAKESKDKELDELFQEQLQ
ncbi:hypothetical protein Tco_1422360 [Tanacetum coccineum]